MTRDTRRELSGLAGTLAIIGAAFLVGYQTVRTITLAWDVNNPPGTVITEVWTSDLITWTHYADVAGSNVTVATTNPAAFFKVRNRSLATGELSDWSRK